MITSNPGLQYHYVQVGWGGNMKKSTKLISTFFPINVIIFRMLVTGSSQLCKDHQHTAMIIKKTQCQVTFLVVLHDIKDFQAAQNTSSELLIRSMKKFLMSTN